MSVQTPPHSQLYIVDVLSYLHGLLSSAREAFEGEGVRPSCRSPQDHQGHRVDGRGGGRLDDGQVRVDRVEVEQGYFDMNIFITGSLETCRIRTRSPSLSEKLWWWRKWIHFRWSLCGPRLSSPSIKILFPAGRIISMDPLGSWLALEREWFARCTVIVVSLVIAA